MCVQERARTGLCNSSLLFQEMFAGYRVLDAVLGLLHLINSLQLEKLNQQIKTSGDTVGQTVLLETEAELFGGNEVVSSPSENVSAVAEEGKYCTPDGDRRGGGGGMPIVLFTSLRLRFARFFFLLQENILTARFITLSAEELCIVSAKNFTEITLEIRSIWKINCLPFLLFCSNLIRSPFSW